MAQPIVSVRRIPQIDSLRGLAAVSVVVAHFTPSGLGGSAPRENGILRPILGFVSSVSLGNMAVVFFFSLSSFLLTYLAKNEFLKTGDFSIKR
jgi:peptidoglycan/LPS O-acetylase OafA/YrhL